MLFKPLAFVATAAAFVIVPQISETDEEIFKALPVHAETFTLPPSALSQSLSVPCPQCKGKDSRLRLDFDVAGPKLLLNGFELYPHANPWNGDLTAILAEGDGREKEQRLGYSLAIEPAARDQDQQMQLINVELRVIEVGSRFVEGVPAIQVQLVKAATEDIAIGNVVLKDADGMNCGSVWCKAKGLAGEVFKALKSFKGKGCGRHRHHKGHPHGHKVHADAGIAPLHGGRPDHGTMEEHQPNWRKFLKNIASYIFLPILMGITAGVAVAVLAMLICSVVVRLTRFARCKRSRGARCCRRKQRSRQQATDIEKVGLMEENPEEPPPQYRGDDANK
ncbi:Uncharacterized protein TCAP_03554 [Tolypocladium capitatum]|uniref:DUF7728 domain-containing protein n=1 Tax=Tolypocladium capitatum TaxID=45235 RepID=A0A2K3QG44_9HYPO|nr:Uncharacterized protein TCAP_03554 [Tolypocladium capitatum]